jgi:integrase
VQPVVVDHLAERVAPEPTAWLFPGAGSQPVAPRTLDRAWTRARETVGRSDLRLHDLRHSGLTWAAATGATTAELMSRAGHASPAAALRYQHATQDRDRALADALAALSGGESVRDARALSGPPGRRRSADVQGPAPLSKSRRTSGVRTTRD